MDIVVAYDIANTDTTSGASRLRRLSDVCASYGGRAQQSVFECRVSPLSFHQMQDEIRQVVDVDQDSVVIYRVLGDLATSRTVIGQGPRDLGQPWIV